MARFPSHHRADSDGLLLVGGELTTEWLLDAYTQGIFPWPVVDEEVEILAWFSPDPRTIVELENFHVSRRLARRIRQGHFTATFDQSFADVMRGCADRGQKTGTWITPAMIRAYERLHRLGWAHSVEVWHEDQLVGGVYGIAIGGYFAGESMFHRRTDGSKVALHYLVEHLKARGFTLFDVQQWTSHLGSLGASLIRRREFLARLKAAIALKVEF